MKDVKQFDEALKELEAVVKSLESEMPLEEAVKAFEKGVALSKTCLDALKAEKGKIQLLTDDVNKLTEEFNIND